MSMSLFEAAKAVVQDMDNDVPVYDDSVVMDNLKSALTAQREEWRKRREASEHVTPYEIGPENEMCAKRKTTGVYEYLGPADEIAVWNEYFGYSADGKRDLLEER